MTLGVRRWFEADPLHVAAASRAALAWPLGAGDEAELWLARPVRSVVTLGAFARDVGEARAEEIVRRGSGGPAVRMGEGSLWIALILPRVDALVACDEPRILNRHVRPLLRALTKCGALAHFFGRDWVSVKHRPAAWVGFAHSRATGRTVVEAVVACSTPFDVAARASYLGKAPGTLAEIVGREVAPARLADAVVAAWAEASGRAAVDRGALPSREELHALAPPLPDDVQPPWLATLDEAIGPLSAGPDAHGAFRVGGDLLVSSDALADLERALTGAPDDAVGALVDTHLGAPGVALDGVRSLDSVRDVILAARAAHIPAENGSGRPVFVETKR